MANSTTSLPLPHTLVGVGGVLERGGKVLVNRAVYRERFTLPSGYVEAGETLEAALVREFLEETGVHVRVGPLLLTRHKVVERTWSDLYLAFRLEYVSGEPAAQPPEIAEVREVDWAHAEEATWISSLSRLVIRLAHEGRTSWPLARWDGGEAPVLATSAWHSADLPNREHPRRARSNSRTPPSSSATGERNG